MSKRYYKVIRTFGHGMTPTIRFWHCSSDTILTLKGVFIIPLDRKPASAEYIREGV